LSRGLGHNPGHCPGCPVPGIPPFAHRVRLLGGEARWVPGSRYWHQFAPLAPLAQGARGRAELGGQARHGRNRCPGCPVLGCPGLSRVVLGHCPGCLGSGCLGCLRCHTAFRHRRAARVAPRAAGRHAAPESVPRRVARAGQPPVPRALFCVYRKRYLAARRLFYGSVDSHPWAATTQRARKARRRAPWPACGPAGRQEAGYHARAPKPSWGILRARTRTLAVSGLGPGLAGQAQDCNPHPTYDGQAHAGNRRP